MFDINEAFRKSGIGEDDRERILRHCREDFKDDEMMYELHVIRAINAFKQGYIKKHVGIVKETKVKYFPRSISAESDNNMNE